MASTTDSSRGSPPEVEAIRTKARVSLKALVAILLANTRKLGTCPTAVCQALQAGSREPAHRRASSRVVMPASSEAISRIDAVIQSSEGTKSHRRDADVKGLNRPAKVGHQPRIHQPLKAPTAQTTNRNRTKSSIEEVAHIPLSCRWALEPKWTGEGIHQHKTRPLHQVPA